MLLSLQPFLCFPPVNVLSIIVRSRRAKVVFTASGCGMAKTLMEQPLTDV